MKKFLKKVLIMLLLIALVMGVIICFDRFVIKSQYLYSYQAAAIDKVARLKSIDEPKIILVGNSNVAFGFDSALLEEEMNMPVVNMGLHGNMGNAFHEQMAKTDIDKGDIVVVCHNSFSDDDQISSPELAWITYDYHDELLPLFRAKDYGKMLVAYPSYLRDSYIMWLRGNGNKDSGDCYSRTAFNEYGDVEYKPDSLLMSADEYYELGGFSTLKVPEINDTCINRLNELNDYCKNKGATLVVAGYPIADGKYTEYTKEDFKKFESELKSRLDCEVISDYADYFYPYEYFYNTYFHLTKEGARVRTLQLVDDLNDR